RDGPPVAPVAGRPARRPHPAGATPTAPCTSVRGPTAPLANDPGRGGRGRHRRRRHHLRRHLPDRALTTRDRPPERPAAAVRAPGGPDLAAGWLVEGDR